MFGTSPPYLQLCEDSGYVAARASWAWSPCGRSSRPARSCTTGSTTGSSEHVGPMPLQSISGGTDIVGCFVLGQPEPARPPRREPVPQPRPRRPGAAAPDAPASSVGELVCRNPFPSRPLGLYGDPTGAGSTTPTSRSNPGVWTHGDLIEFTPTGTARMHGRSDGVLNVRGIRIGPAEIYTRAQRRSRDRRGDGGRAADAGGDRRLADRPARRAARRASPRRGPARAHPRARSPAEASPAHVPSLIAAGRRAAVRPTAASGPSAPPATR